MCLQKPDIHSNPNALIQRKINKGKILMHDLSSSFDMSDMPFHDKMSQASIVNFLYVCVTCFEMNSLIHFKNICH